MSSYLAVCARCLTKVHVPSEGRNILRLGSCPSCDFISWVESGVPCDDEPERCELGIRHAEDRTGTFEQRCTLVAGHLEECYRTWHPTEPLAR